MLVPSLRPSYLQAWMGPADPDAARAWDRYVFAGTKTNDMGWAKNSSTSLFEPRSSFKRNPK